MTPEQQIEIRLAALEEARNIFNGFSIRQMAINQETHENLTILLGIARGQERDIRIMQADISAIKTDLGAVSDRLSGVETRLESIEVQLGREFGAVNEQLAEIRALLTGGTEPKSPEP